MRTLIAGLFKLGVVALTVALVLGWFQTLHTAFDSLSHFRLHLVAMLLVALVLLVIARKWNWAAVSMIVVAISLWLTAPYLPGASIVPTNGAAQALPTTDLRVVQFNMRFNNEQPDKAIAALRSVDADVYLLQELTARTEPIYRDLAKTHPYVLECRTGRLGSVALASRYPFDPAGHKNCRRDLGFATATIMVKGQSINIASLHLRWPWPFDQYHRIRQLEEPLRTLKGPVILAGDFNAAPWSAVVARVASLIEAKVAGGLALSWAPRFKQYELDIGPVLPIDQILYRDVIPIRRQILDDGGSDHFPFLTEFSVEQ